MTYYLEFLFIDFESIKEHNLLFKSLTPKHCIQRSYMCFECAEPIKTQKYMTYYLEFLFIDFESIKKHSLLFKSPTSGAEHQNTYSAEHTIFYRCRAPKPTNIKRPAKNKFIHLSLLKRMITLAITKFIIK